MKTMFGFAGASAAGAFAAMQAIRQTSGSSRAAMTGPRKGRGPGGFAIPPLSARRRVGHHRGVARGSGDMPGRLTVLVTGSAGRIGRAAVRELKARGHRVRGFDRVPTLAADEDFVGDLTDAAALALAAQGAQAMIHLAATPDDDDFLTQLVPN